MAAHIQPLTHTIECGDEFELRSRNSLGRQIRVVQKAYNSDLTITYHVEQTKGGGRMKKTSISEKWLKHSYKRVMKVPRSLYRPVTREVFVDLEPTWN